MKKLALLLIVLITLTGCEYTDKDVYEIEFTLTDGTVDTLMISRAYNKQLRDEEERLVKSDQFTQDGIKSAYSLAINHPVGKLYLEDGIEEELLKMEEEVRFSDDPLGPRLVDKTLVFNRSLKVLNSEGNPIYGGLIESFRVLSITANGETTTPVVVESKLLQFVNHPSVTIQELDNISYVRTSSAEKIVASRPLTLEQLDAISWVGVNTLKNLEEYAETWINPDPVVTASNNPPIITKVELIDGNYQLFYELPPNSLIPSGGFDVIVNGDDRNNHATESPMIISADSTIKNCFTIESRYVEDNIFPTSNEFCYTPLTEAWKVRFSPISVDGDQNTVWENSRTGVTDITFNFEEVFFIKSILYLPRQDSSTLGDVKGYTILKSDDNITWETVNTGELNSSKELKNVPINISTQYLNFRLDSYHSGNYANIAEIDVSGYK